MADRKRGIGGLKTIVLVVLLGVAVWFGRKGWIEATCPGEEQVMAQFVETASVPAEDDWTSEDIAAYWADDEGEVPMLSDDWEFRARSVFLRFGSTPKGTKPDERIVLTFRGLEGMEGERLIVCARPATFFARMRLFFNELGEDMSISEQGLREVLGVWNAPDR